MLDEFNTTGTGCITTVTGVGQFVPTETAKYVAEVNSPSFIEDTPHKDVMIARLIDHVNREIGVAQDTPLVERLALLEALCEKNFAKIKEKFNY